VLCGSGGRRKGWDSSKRKSNKKGGGRSLRLPKRAESTQTIRGWSRERTVHSLGGVFTVHEKEGEMGPVERKLATDREEKKKGIHRESREANFPPAPGEREICTKRGEEDSDLLKNKKRANSASIKKKKTIPSALLREKKRGQRGEKRNINLITPKKEKRGKTSWM